MKAVISVEKQSRSKAYVSALVLGSLLLVGCATENAERQDSERGSETEDNVTDTGSGAQANGVVADLVPEEYRERGYFRGEYIAYPPFTNVPEDGDRTAPIGFITELMTEASALLNMDIEWELTNFDTFATNVNSGRSDFFISAVFDTEARREVVDLVDISTDGGGILVPAGNPNSITSPEEMCGHTISSTAGTVFPTEQLPEFSELCEENGEEPIHIVTAETSPLAIQMVDSGRADAYVDGFGAVAYAASQTEGVLEAATEEPYSAVVQGVAFAKDSDLAPAFRDAIQLLVNDGRYEELLIEYGIEGLAIDCITINVEERSEFC